MATTYPTHTPLTERYDLEKKHTNSNVKKKNYRLRKHRFISFITEII